MSLGIFKVAVPKNEPVRDYAPESAGWRRGFRSSFKK